MSLTFSSPCSSSSLASPFSSSSSLSSSPSSFLSLEERINSFLDLKGVYLASPIECSMKFWEIKRKNTFRKTSDGGWDEDGGRREERVKEESEEERRLQEGKKKEQDGIGWRLSLNSKLYRKRKESCGDK